MKLGKQTITPKTFQINQISQVRNKRKQEDNSKMYDANHTQAFIMATLSAKRKIL